MKLAVDFATRPQGPIRHPDFTLDSDGQADGIVDGNCTALKLETPPAARSLPLGRFVATRQLDATPETGKHLCLLLARCLLCSTHLGPRMTIFTIIRDVLSAALWCIIWMPCAERMRVLCPRLLAH